MIDIARSDPRSSARLATLMAAVGCIALVASACRPTTPEAVVADAIGRTEDIRGLAATGPVSRRFVSADVAFDDLIDEWLGAEEARAAVADGLVYEKLGLLPPGFDMLESIETSTRTGVLGYYEHEDDAITVIADEADLSAEDLWVLSHEHVHALQDHHFDLARLDALEDDEAAALAALVEGEATIMGSLFAVKRLGAALEDLDEAPTDVELEENVPMILAREGEFPYIDGSAFVFENWDGDWSTVDELWADPPVSTEQIMHPERYPDDTPVEIELPDLAGALGPGWSLADEMVLGEMRIGVLLAAGNELVYQGDEDEVFAFPKLARWWAAEGWGGDRLGSLEGPDGDWAIVWQTAWDRDNDADEFRHAVEDALEDGPNASATLRGHDVTGAGLPYPVLVLIAPDQRSLDQLTAAFAS